MITIDGSAGEGGGQVLRSSLSLAAITGQAFRIENIRAKREKPGLMRQHLTCVRAAAEICGAQVMGDELRSDQVEFVPDAVKAGDYRFAVGTGGSTSLVAQTILLPLALADGPSRVSIEGGTHNMTCPPFEFIARAFLPQLARMGFRIEAELSRRGFYPAGGGRVDFAITPTEVRRPIDVRDRGMASGAIAEAFISKLPIDIAKRELKVAGARLGLSEPALKLREDKNSLGPGNALVLTLPHTNVTEVVTGFGQLGVSAENVAKRACKQARAYLAGSAAVGPHLADQLLLPMAIVGGGGFTTGRPSLHTRTNMDIIERFLPIRFKSKEVEPGTWEIQAAP